MAKYAKSIDEMPPVPEGRFLRRFIGRHLPSVSLALMVALLVAIVLFPYTIITVHSGNGRRAVEAIQRL